MSSPPSKKKLDDKMLYALMKADEGDNSSPMSTALVSSFLTTLPGTRFSHTGELPMDIEPHLPVISLATRSVQVVFSFEHVIRPNLVTVPRVGFPG